MPGIIMMEAIAVLPEVRLAETVAMNERSAIISSMATAKAYHRMR